MRILFLYIVTVVSCFSSCKLADSTADDKLLTDADVLHRNVDQLTRVIIHDVFSPPVSSRIYAYTSIAAYEALRFQDSNAHSISSRLNGFPALPAPQKNKSYNFILAATEAFFTVAEKVTFSVDTLKQYQNKLYSEYQALLDESTFENSIEFGAAVGKKILERATADNYKETRGMAKFLGSHEDGKWRPTPPDYLDAAEPHWHRLKPLLLSSSSLISCPAPPVFSKDTSSPFYKSVKEVYSITTNLTDEQKQIAKYWDDNPFVIEHSGHMMVGNKKITPVGHWIGITSIACRQNKASPIKSAEAYALTSIAMFDAIISCWKSKYEYQHIRPVSVINEWIDPYWQPFLQTPPFPEHTSGHSGISASAATILTELFGDNNAFEDTADMEYIGMKKSFSSFHQAAQEASISRVYGGIHFRTGVDAGAEQGRRVAEYVSEKLMNRQSAETVLQ
jgi:hypothetical protein